jgi:hypothetical protein
MKRALCLLLLAAFTGEAAAEQLDRYPNGRAPVPPDIMICSDPDSVDLEVETISSDPQNGILLTRCGVTGPDHSANMLFYKSGVSSKYYYDVLELKLWKKRGDGKAQIYLGTFFTVGNYMERPGDEQMGELQLSPTN